MSESFATTWYLRIRETGFSPHPTGAVHSALVDLTRQLRQAVELEDGVELRSEVRAVGAGIARLHFLGPEALGRTLEVVGTQLPASCATIVLAELAAGFCEEARQAVLSDQEQARAAELAVQDQIEHELARTRQQLARGTEAARLRLAQELHDDAVQDVLGVRLLLQVAADDLAVNRRSRTAVGESIADAVGHLDEINRKLRAHIAELRPAGLEERGLVAALENYVAGMRRDPSPDQPTITLDLPSGESALPVPVARCLFRVAQEALRNTRKHSACRKVTMVLGVAAEGAKVLVHDDGRGFIVPSPLSRLAARHHFGLVGLAEQVSWLDGTFDITSSPAHGTTVSAHIALPCRALEIE